MKKQIITQILQEQALVPVFYHKDLEVCKRTIKACYDGGLRVFEYTDRGKNAKQNFPELKNFISKQCKGMYLGVGSIINKKQALDFINLGADFIVSPILNKGVAKIANKHSIYWIPGCATLTEIINAEKLGADIIKIFPGNILKPDFVKAVKGPVQHLKLMPTGGVEPTSENLNKWFEAGVVAVGMGSKLITKECLENPDLLKQRVKETLSLIDKLTNK